MSVHAARGEATPQKHSPSQTQENAQLQAVIRLANTYAKSDANYKRAAEIVKTMEIAHPGSAYVYAGIAEIDDLLYQDGDSVSATTVLAAAEKAISLDPKLPDPYIVVAKLSADQHRWFEAQQAANTAIRLAPHKPEAMFAEARAAEGEGRWASAESWFKKCLVAHKTAARKGNIYFWLSQLYQKEKPPRYAAAQAAMRKAMAFNPSDWWMQERYANFLINHTHDFNDAVKYAELALTNDKNGPARVDLAIALYAKWAEAFLAHGNKRTKYLHVLGPKAIQTRTGVSPGYIFGNVAVVKALGFIPKALVRANIIRNIDVVTGGNCCTALVGAAYANNVALAKLLITRNANINATDSTNGYTPLMYFVWNDNVTATKYLINHGADVNVVDARGVPLIQHALTNSQTHGATLVDELLAHGADPTVTNANGQNLLYVAAAQNQTALVKQLIKDYKMNVNLAASNGWTPLVIAAVSGGPYKQTVAALLAAGANPWVKYGPYDILNSLNFPDTHTFPQRKEILAMIVAARKHYPEPKGFPALTPVSPKIAPYRMAAMPAAR